MNARSGIRTKTHKERNLNETSSHSDSAAIGIQSTGAIFTTRTSRRRPKHERGTQSRLYQHTPKHKYPPNRRGNIVGGHVPGYTRA